MTKMRGKILSNAGTQSGDRVTRAIEKQEVIKEIKKETDCCNFFLGSHGCDISPDIPHTIHVCKYEEELCMEYTETQARHWNDSLGAYSNWEPHSGGFWG